MTSSDTPGRAPVGRLVGASLLLLLLTAGVFWPVRHYDFSHYDDRPYIEWNPHVRTGLTWENARWAFTGFYKANWHPLTWISHMLDVEISGLDPGGHHLTNLVFHCANVVLLLLLFTAMTGALGRSALLAALFAVHPLHVESVAWVAERKDVLSTFLLLLTIWAYLRYVRRPCSRRAAVLPVIFGLGLMAKPMLVTLPCALLLLDWWPLGRAGQRPPAGPASLKERGWARLLLEKAPLFLLAALSSGITWFAQQEGGSMTALEVIPLGPRIANAIVSYAAYLEKTAWPADLAVLYPFPLQGHPIWRVAGSGAALLLLTGMVLRFRQSRPAAVAGWFWYLGTLVPVIGLVQVGIQAMADRYTYVPLIGIFMAFVWVAGDGAAGWRRGRAPVILAAGVIIAALAVTARAQVGQWLDGATLGRLARPASGDWSAFLDAGTTHESHGRLAEAEAAYRRALGIKPDLAAAHNNLGYILFLRGRNEEALAHLREAIRLQPASAEACYNLGFLLANLGRFDEAASSLRNAIRLKPDYAKPRDLMRNLGIPP